MQLKARAIVEMEEMLMVVVASPSETPETLLVVVFARLQAILNDIQFNSIQFWFNPSISKQSLMVTHPANTCKKEPTDILYQKMQIDK